VLSRLPSNPFAAFPSLLARVRELDAKLEDRTNPEHPECSFRLFVQTTASCTLQYTRRCPVCGKRTGKTAIGHAELGRAEKLRAEAIDAYRPVWGRYWSAYNARRDAMRSELRRIRWETPGFYALYLGSAEWAAKRQEVLARAREGHPFPVCESCAVNPATEVHHLSYGRLGNEPPEDLMAVCGTCHAEIESEKEARREETRERYA
jgi:hypothetical protein